MNKNFHKIKQKFILFQLITIKLKIITIFNIKKVYIFRQVIYRINYRNKRTSNKEPFLIII